MQTDHLFFEFNLDGKLRIIDSALFSDENFRLFGGKQFPKPRLFERKNRVMILVGHPMLNHNIDDKSVADELFKTADLTRSARALDGSFLIIIYDKNSKSIVVINDRFAGFAIYFTQYKKGHIVGGLSFRDIFVHRKVNGGGNISQESLLMFIWLRKLIGEDTFIKEIEFLRSASLLCASSEETTIHCYWHPCFNAEHLSGSKLVSELAQGIEVAVESYMSDNKEFGLFLSGGLDSRAILAAAKYPLACFTTSLKPNNETNIALMAAKLKGSNFHFLPREISFLDKRLDEATSLSGMQVFTEAQFLGYGELISQNVDVLMLGLGFDVFFAGLYMPKRPSKFLGREALNFELLSIDPNFNHFFLDNVKYRLKTSDPLSVLNDIFLGRAQDILSSKIQAIKERGQSSGAEGLQLWEYMHIHNFSRHYSFPMLSSVRTFSECRAPALSNRLFDLTILMDPKDKIDGEAYQQAIAKISPNLMRLQNANTNLPAVLSPKQQTLVKTALFPFYKMGLTKLGSQPHWKDRSWPDPYAQLSSSPTLKNNVSELPTCEILKSTGLFCSKKIQFLIDDHSNKKHDHTVLINQLLTISSILRDPEKIEMEKLCADSLF